MSVFGETVEFVREQLESIPLLLEELQFGREFLGGLQSGLAGPVACSRAARLGVKLPFLYVAVQQGLLPIAGCDVTAGTVVSDFLTRMTIREVEFWLHLLEIHLGAAGVQVPETRASGA
jgi:hypothetical protein